MKKSGTPHLNQVIELNVPNNGGLTSLQWYSCRKCLIWIYSWGNRQIHSRVILQNNCLDLHWLLKQFSKDERTTLKIAKETWQLNATCGPWLYLQWGEHIKDIIGKNWGIWICNAYETISYQWWLYWVCVNGTLVV